MERVDVAIVGAGVVGLAAAARLAREDRTVLVLESHSRYGVETSSRNSEVVHAGLYYAPGSLKATLCREGRETLYRWGEDGGFFIRKTGKLVVASDAGEAAGLEALLARSHENGAVETELLDGAEARRRVPGLKAEAALWSPESGIVDSEELMRHCHARAEAGGAMFLFGSPLRRAERADGGYELAFGADEERVLARNVVNAGGLHADTIAALAGIDPDEAGYRIHWCKGRYFRCRAPLELPHLVYPMPGSYGLGIHLTMDRAGRVRLGPDTQFVDTLDYGVDPSLAPAFHEAVTRYWPGLKLEDLSPDTAGIRPKLSGPGEAHRDFVIAEESARGLPGWVNCIGIESPGLTASPAIAERVARLLEL